MCATLFFACQSQTSPQGQEEVKVKKNIGIQLYSLRDDIKKDFDGTIKALGEMGYTEVEAAGYGDGKFYDLSPADYKKAIEDAGMRMVSSHTGGPKMDFKKADKSEAWEWWDQCIAAHKEAGASYVVVPYMRTPEKLDELKLYCDYYNEVGKKCNDAGLRFGYHNHDFEFKKIEDKVMYDFMLENTNPELVFFQMDVYWTVMGGKSPVEYFEKYPGRFEMLHIKDEKELGESGMVGFDAIFKNIKTAGAKHLVVEVERYSYEPKESVKRSLEYLNNASFVEPDYSK
ncbi:sugar phosphate isomerase [Bacteroidales bacterium]|nr:sugar phosphate isomerase [Bacteroidales bacterium]